MKVRLLRKRRGISPGRIGLYKLELFFLLFGLTALDVYIWINASTAIYQTYDEWAFDRRLPPALSVPKIPPAATLKLPEAKPIGPSGVIGRLKIPGLHLTAMIREGADAATLRRAVGHIPGTALPGGMGNVGLAGHRDTFFRALRNIRANDPIELEAENGTYRYVVESTEIVGPRDVRVLASSNAESLTLVTCYPFYFVGSAPKRFVVRAAGLKRSGAPAGAWLLMGPEEICYAGSWTCNVTGSCGCNGTRSSTAHGLQIAEFQVAPRL